VCITRSLVNALFVARNEPLSGLRAQKYTPGRGRGYALSPSWRAPGALPCARRQSRAAPDYLKIVITERAAGNSALA
jgi:hypothetical protein